MIFNAVYVPSIVKGRNSAPLSGQVAFRTLPHMHSGNWRRKAWSQLSDNSDTSQLCASLRKTVWHESPDNARLRRLGHLKELQYPVMPYKRQLIPERPCSTVEGVQYCGGYYQYIWGYSVQWGIPSVPWGDTNDALEDIQFWRGYHQYCVGYHQYTNECSVQWLIPIITWVIPSVTWGIP